jgi:multidrug efflux pump subunit AcrA (membrane-fusion protein)
VPQQRFNGKIKSLSGTASANVWSGDVAKKFDVVFSVDMKELMAGLGARPEQIARVLQTAERNRLRPAVPTIVGTTPEDASSGAFAQQFSEKDLENADLPAPPEANNQLDVLFRPGLLTDVEITVEKVPNAIHIPLQAVFEKDGNPIVYVKNGSRFDERRIRPLKRSESVLVVAAGLSPGEQVALTDPNKDKKGKQQGSGKKSGIPAPTTGNAGGDR